MLLTTHDLKAPFGGIESNIQVMKHQYWDQISDPVRKIVDRIDVRAQTLRERINAILLLGKLRSLEASQRSRRAVDLQSISASVAEELEEKAGARGIVIEHRVPKLSVLGDENQYTILLSNIVSNAIVYSRENGKVTMTAEKRGAEAWVTVSDEGIGIREDALPRIFDEYFHSKEAAKFNKLSTGLGLAIVKEIVRAYELRIRVTSEQERGTTFEIALPMDVTQANDGG
jgi:two-component system phosphate regulon sensor histidine kinase PhoR